MVSDMLSVEQVAMRMYQGLFSISHIQPRQGETVEQLVARVREQARQGIRGANVPMMQRLLKVPTPSQ